MRRFVLAGSTHRCESLPGTRPVRRSLALCIALSCLVAAMLVSEVAFADSVVSFPDPGLNTAVHGALGIPANQDIYRSDLTTLTALTSANGHVSSLEGLEYATNLQDLNLQSNHITDVSQLASCTGLVALYLGDNQVGDITPLHYLVNLDELSLYSNQISDITAVGELPNLTSLSLSQNQITTIGPVANCTKLDYLFLGQNQISDITPVQSLPDLTQLVLWDNHVTTITPVGNCKKLTYLDLGDNQVNDITAVSGLNALTLLGLDLDQVGDISPLAELTNLTHLQLSENRVASVAPLTGLHDLETLALGGNQISDVAPLSGLTKLSQLYLGGNDIWDVSPLEGLSPSYADVSDNWLDFTPGSTASQTVDAWIAHGASPSNLTWLPQKIGSVMLGSVSSSAGGPLSGAHVALSFGPSATTGSSGSYLLPIVPSVAETITISKPYYSSYTTTRSVDPDATYTVNAVLTPLRLPLSMKRSPSGSSLTYKRKKGVAKFTLAVALSDARGAVAGKYVWLQQSSKGKKWSNLYKLKTNSSGKASKAFSVKKKGTTYYRWSVPATAFDRAGVTNKQKVVVK